uniref:IS982 family transposase n=1 Tax=Chryseobacterium elymi TaxID=395936 RepID=UPI001EE8EBC7|nr:IS982 family transposase [Chryseobacterium elymi]
MGDYNQFTFVSTRDIAATGKSTMGWFYGFKLHIIINDKGEFLSLCVTQANIDDREPLKNETFLKAIFGELFGDKSYISEKLTQLLFVDGIQLITSIRNNIKNNLMEMSDKFLLRKCSITETINDELKNICQVEQSRHRSLEGEIKSTLQMIKLDHKIKTVSRNSADSFLKVKKCKINIPRSEPDIQERLMLRQLSIAESGKAFFVHQYLF